MAGAIDPIGVLDDVGDLVPVDVRHVEVDAEPAATADVRRAEEALGLPIDVLGLRTRRRRAPEPEPVVVVVVAHVEERLLATDEPRRLAVAQPLRHLGQVHAQRAQACERGDRSRRRAVDHAVAPAIAP